MRLSVKRALIRFGLFLLVFGSMAGSALHAADHVSHNDSYYVENFTFKKGKPFVYDPYVWAYTKEFAKRFHMPEKWIDRDIKGMQAVAFRMTTIGTTTCGLGKNEQSCWPPMECQMDIYFGSSAPLPWVRENIRQDHFQSGLYSTDYLHYPGHNHYQRYPFVLGGRGPLESGGEIRVGGDRQGNASIKKFNRDFQEGISFISYTGLGVCPKYIGVGRMKFYDKPASVQLRRGLVKEDAVEPIHVFVFSEAFMKRANTIYESANEQNINVTNGLLRRFFDSREQSSE
jgi:hypothetical protein